VTAASTNRRLSSRFRRAHDPIWNQPSILPGRKICCHRCGKAHTVSDHAKTTFCPFCNTAIDLCDITISSITSRPIDTRGDLSITPSGYVCSALTVCSEASIAGRISGALICENTLRLSCSERLSCQVSAGFLVIEERARLELTCPIRAGDLTVYGQAVGNFECTGRILIEKGGLIEGHISASSVVVEPGAMLLAECAIHPTAKQESERADGITPFAGAAHAMPSY
jgi:cytoskeletal protein CcmA (bactofilin family)